MSDGMHCPHCAQDVGVWATLSAILPSRIWCPHCKARLCYRGVWGLTLAEFALGVLIGAVSMHLLLARHWPRAVVLGVAGAIGGCIEMCRVAYLRRYKVLAASDGEAGGSSQ